MSAPRRRRSRSIALPAAQVRRSAALFLLMALAGSVHAEMVIGGYGASETGHPLRVFGPDAQGAAPAEREISGPSTGLDEPAWGVFEPLEQVIYISDFNGRAIRVYPAFASGDVAPIRVLNPAIMGQTRANAPIPEHGELGVITSNCCISTWPLVSEGDAIRLRAISWGGSPSGLTQLNNPSSLTYLPDSDEYAVLDSHPVTGHRQVVFHARSAEGNVEPTRTLTGAALAGAVGMAYDRLSRRLFVLVSLPAVDEVSPGRIAVFADSASGDTPPLHTIEGLLTTLDLPLGHYFYGIGYDPYRDRLMVTATNHQVEGNRVWVFDADASGNVAPVQSLQGSNVSPAIVGIPFGIPPLPPPETIFADGFEF